MTPELSRPLRVHEIGAVPYTLDVEAKPAEREALVKRFGLLTLDRLTASLSAHAEAGGVRVGGRVVAAGAQPCGLSGIAVPFAIDEAVDLRFARIERVAGEEVELSGGDLDVLEIDGDTIDLGEAAAQSFGLALDPYPRASGAELPAQVIPEDKVVPLQRPNPFAVLKRD